MATPSRSAPSVTDSPSPEYSKAAAVDDSTERHGSSLIIGAATVVGFLVLALSGLVLAVKVARWTRGRRERKRGREALMRGQGQGRNEKRKGKRGMNAFEREEWEGVPA